MRDIDRQIRRAFIVASEKANRLAVELRQATQLNCFDLALAILNIRQRCSRNFKILSDLVLLQSKILPGFTQALAQTFPLNIILGM